VLGFELTLGRTVTDAELAAVRSEPDDAALVSAFRGGDRASFEKLVRRHQRPVWAIVQRFARDRDAAEDLAQRTFIIALERIAELRGGFRPWLLRIAVNLAKNHVRDTSRLIRAGEEADAVSVALARPVDPHPDEALHRARIGQMVREAVAELPDRQREVVLLRVDGQLSFAEVGEALGITENNAKVTYHHAVKRLREKLGGTDGGL
jgi:RNA polymerase sigma-70 factor (ECF subfamily)